jgi:hypothetical protein
LPQSSHDDTLYSTPILKEMISIYSAKKNDKKTDRQSRHPITLKKFASLLYINGGSMLYELIHRNMPEALPSLRTVQMMIQSGYKHVCEGYFRFDELLQHL